MIYLLHFDRPYHHARHYLGWTKNKDTLKHRIEQHRHARPNDGTHHSLMVAVIAAGIGFVVAKVWTREGSRRHERRLKNRGGLARVCPICKMMKKELGTNPAQETVTAGFSVLTGGPHNACV